MPGLTDEKHYAAGAWVLVQSLPDRKRIPDGTPMKNGLYSVHIQMLDGVKGRASGVIVVRDGEILGGDHYFWSVGTYTVGNGTWKGEIVTNQHTPLSRQHERARYFGGRRGQLTGFSGTFPGTSVRSFRARPWWAAKPISFRATLRRLADI